MAFVYVLTDPRVTDPLLRIRYVGWTRQTLRSRVSGHVSEAKKLRSTAHRHTWIRSLLKLGVRPEIETYQIVPDEFGPAAEIRAIRLIGLLGAPLTNHTAGGETLGGWAHSEETLRKMRLPKTEEHKRKLRGTPKSPAAREKMRAAKLGRKWTLEHRANIAAAMRDAYASGRRHVTPEQAERVGIRNRQLWADGAFNHVHSDEFKSAQAERTRARWAAGGFDHLRGEEHGRRVSAGIALTGPRRRSDEVRAALAEHMRRRWAEGDFNHLRGAAFGQKVSAGIARAKQRRAAATRNN